MTSPMTLILERIERDKQVVEATKKMGFDINSVTWSNLQTLSEALSDFETAVKALSDISRNRQYLTDKPGKATRSCDISDEALEQIAGKK